MRRGAIDPPTEKELRVLVDFPKGSLGRCHEIRLLQTILNLCKDHGFGRVHQMVNAIEEIWRDPTKVAKWQELKDERFKAMRWDQ